MCLFHKWLTVVEADHDICKGCFKEPHQVPEHLKKEYPKGWCTHSFKVCVKCGKAVGYGSHGKLTVIPDTCKKQIASMKEV